MRLYLVIGAAVLQLAVLGWMAGEREWIVRHGQIVYLRTAPLDPRDVFRGDYVRLNYDISWIRWPLLRDGLRTDKFEGGKRGTVVYVPLAVDASGLGSATAASDRRPAAGPFIRGRTTGRWWSGQSIGVRYGIEAYFMQQGEALKLEQGRRVGGNIQIPLEMEVALSGSGTAVLKGHRWSSLGIGVTVASSPRNATTREISATVVLYNASERPLAVVDLPDHRQWRLVSAWIGNAAELSAAVDATPPPTPTAESIVVLAPGESRELLIDFRQERWFVPDPNKPERATVPITGLDGWWNWRLIYAPPDAEATRGLPNAELIWHGELASAAFNGSGRID